MSITKQVTYLDDWKDLKEYTHEKAQEEAQKKDQYDVTKDFVSDQIDDYRIEDEAQEQEEYAKIYQKIEDISTGGGVDLSPYLKIEDASANFAEKSELEAKADRVDVYTKEETDEKFATKDEVETGLSGKANVRSYILSTV